MKYSIIIIILAFISCKESTEISKEHKAHIEMHKEMDKVDAEFIKFDKQLTLLYSEAKINPESTILKVDSLLLANQNEKDKYKSQIRRNIRKKLNHFKAEIFYQIGEYEKSIDELNNKYDEDDFMFNSGNKACLLAANYLKLKQYEKSKSLIDSIRIHYIDRYALGNYYESIGDKKKALKIYENIKFDKTIKHYAFHKLAVDRYTELQKKDYKLLNEIFCPPNDPSYVTADSDSKNRNKIFSLMEKLPENQTWAGTSIVESPQINEKNYYWVKVRNNKNEEFDYYIYLNTFEIKYFDPKRNILLTLEEWRKERKNGI